MSIQGDIEADLAGKLETAIVGVGNAETGSLSQPKAEGRPRVAAVRATVGSSTRLAFGQNEWAEAYAVTVWWSRVAVNRATRADEWEAFAEALRLDSWLGGTIAGVYDAFLSDTSWGDAIDSPWVTMSAVVVVSRVE